MLKARTIDTKYACLLYFLLNKNTVIMRLCEMILINVSTYMFRKSYFFIKTRFVAWLKKNPKVYGFP